MIVIDWSKISYPGLRKLHCQEVSKAKDYWVNDLNFKACKVFVNKKYHVFAEAVSYISSSERNWIPRVVFRQIDDNPDNNIASIAPIFEDGYESIIARYRNGK